MDEVTTNLFSGNSALFCSHSDFDCIHYCSFLSFQLLAATKLERLPPKSATPDDRSQWIAEPVILLQQSPGTVDSCDRVQEYELLFKLYGLFLSLTVYLHSFFEEASKS